VDRHAARERIIARAHELGFVAVGVAGLQPYRRARRRTLDAIAQGRMDGMEWLSPQRIDVAADLGRRYPWARSALSLAWPYQPSIPLRGARAGSAPVSPPGRPRGRMAAYACTSERGHGGLHNTAGGSANGDGAGRPADYHDILSAACDELSRWLSTEYPGARCKHFIDHGWAMDRPIAERAGVGFAGKNTTLITREAGSYVLLADMLISLPLTGTRPTRRNCGSCSACLPACPTGALIAPGVMDARRCISYLTIEHRGSIPEEMRPLMGTWAFGCDLCQEACPINQRLAPEALPAAETSTSRGPVPFPDLIELIELDEEAFRRRFRSTAVWRAGRAGLARNAAIALGNAGDAGALPALRRARDSDPDPVVRESAAWAISRLNFQKQAVQVVPAEHVRGSDLAAAPEVPQ